MNCLSVGSFHRVQSFRNRLLQCRSPMGSQVLPANLLQRGLLSPRGHRSCQEPAPGRAFHGVTDSFRPIHLLWSVVLHGLQVDICSTMDLHGLQGYNLPHHGLHHGLQGNLCFGTWITSSSSFFTDLGVCRVVSLTCSYSSLPLQMPLHVLFLLLNYVITETPPPSPMGLALASSGSILE